MLQKAFFKVNVVDRIYDTPVFEKTTPGAYEFTIPDGYNYVVVEYAGAGGGDGYGGDGTLVAKGRGGVLKIQKTKIKNLTINGIVASVGGAPNGGTGYNNGQNGTVVEGSSGGGGGGSTSVVFNNKIYVASGGAGESRSGGPLGLFAGKGGNGGGPYAGKHTTATEPNNIVDATDPGKIGLNSGDGYVKIWAGYDPYLKG